ncbi:hypothetical protein CKO28_16105 [Rhodovibrio sodomensis]|uniref:Flagellar hook-length control protein-like C-terminal domain-containing protein n=1 Tax=Rhodovibrio sodomensis TaxID=1088 RepID=A0ABS1DIK2_9PROT|nr:flagellar hook-length control protein FliK [Rhodovibrio sodomensis]MBK1669563.1 hypothetical protein [Rhodovibrio sodomensis]
MTIDAAGALPIKVAGPNASKDGAGQDAAGLFAGLMALMSQPNAALPGSNGESKTAGQQTGAAVQTLKAEATSGGQVSEAGSAADGKPTEALARIAALIARLSGGANEAARLQVEVDGKAAPAKLDPELLAKVRQAMAAGAPESTQPAQVGAKQVVEALRAVAAEGRGESAQTAREMLAAGKALADGRARLAVTSTGEGIKVAVQQGEERIPGRAAPAGLLSLQAEDAAAGKHAARTAGRVEADTRGARGPRGQLEPEGGRGEIRVPERRGGLAAIRPTELRPAQPEAQTSAPARTAGEPTIPAAALKGEAQTASSRSNGTSSAQTAIGAASGTAAVNAAGASATPTPAGSQAAMAAQQTAQQIASGVRRASANGQGRVQIQLHPRELGRVDVRMEFADDGLRVRISVERAETLDMMNRDARALERALQDAGVRTQDGGLSFDLKGQGRHAGSGQLGDGASADDPAELTEETTEDTEAHESAGSRDGWTDQGRFDLTV